jgi:protein-S-isoprenylcysteine O-methyltransferase Ste14
MTTVDPTGSKSRLYGLIQSVLFCLYAAAVFFGPKTPRLLTGNASRLASDLLCIAGMALLFAGIFRLGHAIQIDPIPRQDASLVTTGIYRWFRHPIYTSIVVVVIGLFLHTPTPAVALASVIVIGYLAVKVRFEEKLLAMRYPDYEQYRQRSWGLIPWPHSRSKPEDKPRTP